MLRGKTLIEWSMVTLVCGALAWVASHQQWLWRFDTVLYDTALAYHSAPPDPEVVIVAIDDRSLEDIGRWPWSRAVHAALLERLTALGARVVVFDVILHELDRDHPAADAALAASIAAHGAVVLPVTHAQHGASSGGEALPAPIFASAAAALGHIHIELDPDGIARSLYLWEGMHVPRYPQLALAALQLASPQRAARYAAPVSQAEQPGWWRAGWIHIPFIGPPGSFSYVSYSDVLRGEVPADALRGAIAFVGASAVGMGDMVPTPTSGHAGLMPGVEIHTTVFNALRRGESIQRASPVAAAAFNLSLVLLLMVVMLRSRPRAAMLATFGMVALAIALSWSMLSMKLVWFSPAASVVVCLLAYPLWSWRRLEASRHYFEVELEALREAGSGFDPSASMARRPVVVDPFVERIDILHEAANRQRNLQRSRDETVDFLSHDLRSPLASIVTTLEAARTGPALEGDPERCVALFDRVDRNARSALDMAENLVRMIRAESIDPLRFSELGLDTLVEEAGDEVWMMARAKQLNFATDIDVPDEAEMPCVVNGDPDLLRRAIHNLLNNAIKYTPEGGEVRLRLSKEGPGWVIQVADTGPGMTKAQLGRLFQRFSRLPTAENRSVGGAGLGLLMVRTVIERHGGSVSVASCPGEGSTFSIHLPACVPRT